MYRAIEYFTDLQDDNYAYNIGDVYPREGVVVSEDRLKELSSADNKRGRALIELVQSTAQKTAEEEPAEKSVEAEDEEPAEKPKKKSKKSK